MMINASAFGVIACFEVNRLYLSLRLGRWEVFAQRETAPAQRLITHSLPGEIILDLPGFSIALENHQRTERHFRAAQG